MKKLPPSKGPYTFVLFARVLVFLFYVFVLLVTLLGIKVIFDLLLKVYS